MTEIIQIDFGEGRPVYSRIEEHLKDKEIGVLGKIFHNFIYCILNIESTEWFTSKSFSKISSILTLLYHP